MNTYKSLKNWSGSQIEETYNIAQSTFFFQYNGSVVEHMQEAQKARFQGATT